ncbi:MAG: acyltransferase [Oscillospiraceae bacterium]|nr:acyltransferase [Oscillospiraceae bacterium]
MELTNKDTKMVQGISILAMACLHVFSQNYQGLFSPVLFINSIPLSFYFAQLCDFCVMGFAFCSGYAHMTLFESDPHFYRNRLISLLKLFCSFWLIALVFSVVSLISGHGEFMPGSLKRLLGNLSLISLNYNGAWWYMYAYTTLVLLSPLILKTVKRFSPAIVLICGFILYFAAYYLRFEVETENWFLLRLGPTGTTLFEYLIGAVFAKACIFSNLYKYWQAIPKLWRIVLSLVVFVIMLLAHTLILRSLFVAPFTGIVIITLFHFWKKPAFIRNAATFMGTHSTNIWLTHMFFYLVLFKDLVYVARYPLLIYAFMILLTVIVSFLLRLIEKPVHQGIDKLFAR